MGKIENVKQLLETSATEVDKEKLDELFGDELVIDEGLDVEETEAPGDEVELVKSPKRTRRSAAETNRVMKKIVDFLDGHDGWFTASEIKKGIVEQATSQMFGSLVESGAVQSNNKASKGKRYARCEFEAWDSWEAARRDRYKKMALSALDDNPKSMNEIFDFLTQEGHDVEKVALQLMIADLRESGEVTMHGQKKSSRYTLPE